MASSFPVPESSGTSDVPVTNDADQNLAHRINLVKNAAPIFGVGAPGAQAALQYAQSSMDDDTMIRTAQVAGSQALIGGIKDTLDGIADPLQKWKQYNGLDAGAKRLLAQGGYVPPAEQQDNKDPGLMGTLMEFAGMAGQGLHDVTSITGLQPILDFAGKGISQVQHLARAASYGIQQGNTPEVQARRQNTIADFMYLWDKTGTGEKTFTEASQARVHQKIDDPDKYQFVEAMASGVTPMDYLTKTLKLDPAAPTFLTDYAKYAQYQADPDIQASVADLKNNKISLGRTTANVVGLAPGSAPYNILSGGVDAAFDLVADPTLIAGKFAQEYRVAQYGIDLAKAQDAETGVNYLSRRVDYLMTKPRFQQAADIIAQHVNADNLAALPDTLPQTWKGLQDMHTYFRDIPGEITRDHVADYYKSQGGKLGLAKGIFDVPHFDTTSLPSQTFVGEIKQNLVTGVKAKVETFRLADYGLDNMSLADLNARFGLRAGTTAAVQNGIGEFLKGFMTKIPHEDFINPMDPGAAKIFSGMMNYALPDHIHDDFLNQFLAAPTFENKRAVYNSAIDAMWQYSGASETDAGKKLYATITQRDQVFAANGVDVLGNDPAAIDPADMAKGWQIPKFREMLQATKDTTVLRHVLDETNDGMMTRFMSYWRPSVLLRAGFIPRAYGEETLSFILRHGPMPFIGTQLASIGTKEGELGLLKGPMWLADAMTNRIPLVGDTYNVIAHNVAGNTSNFVRDWAEKLAPEKYLRTAQVFARHPEILNALSRTAGTAQGMVADDLTSQVKHAAITIGDRSATGEVSQIPVAFGDITQIGRGDLGYHHTNFVNMKKMADSPLFGPMMDAGYRAMNSEEGTQLANLLVDQGIVPEHGASYGRTLLNAKNTIPPVPLRNFEMLLKNDAFVSSKAVVEELTAAGMEPGDAQNLVSVARDAMTPRQRTAIFTQDGELEKMLKARSTDPNAGFDVASDIPVVRAQVETQARKDYEQHLLDLWSDGDKAETIRRVGYQRLSQGDMEQARALSRRANETLDNRVVAQPVHPGYRRVYTLIASPEVKTQSAFEDLGVASLGDYVDKENGWVPITAGEAKKALPMPMGSTKVIEHAGEAIPQDEMAWFSGSHEDAQQLQQQLLAKRPNLPVQLGYTDIPEDVYNSGRTAATREIQGGIDPLAKVTQGNQVYVPKIYRGNFTAVGDDSQIIDGQLSAGVDQSTALKDWAHVGHARWNQVFGANVGGDDAVMKEIQYKALHDTLKLDDLWNLTPNQLPDYAVGPRVMLPKTANWLHSLYTKGFDQIQGAGDALIRHPMFMHYYTEHEPGVRATVENLLGDPAANAKIDEIAQHLGISRGDLTHAWYSMHPDVRGAADPLQAAVARDPIPPTLRSLNQEQITRIGNASEALYQAKDGIPLSELEADKEFMKGLKKAQVGLQDATDSYLSLPDKARQNILDNGLPEVFPRELSGLGSAPRPFGMSEQAYVERVNDLHAKTLAAEKESDPATWTAEQKAAYESGDFEKFSQLRGYTGQEIADHQEWLRLTDLGQSYDYKFITPDQVDASDLYREHQNRLASRAPSGSPLSTDQWTDLRDAIDSNRHIENTINEITQTKAIDSTIPWIHDHHLRSQFQEHARNFIPFWFAQENFIKRVANMVVRDPAVVRKLQLGVQGMQNVGVFSKNQFGEDVFNIPGTGALVNVLSRAADFFGKYSIPQVNPFSGQVSHLFPGIQELTNIAPSFSPIITIPYTALKRQFPEVGMADSFVLGDQGGNKTVPQQLMPSWLYNTYKGIVGDPKGDQTMMNSQIQAAQMMEANGHGLPENASADVKQEYFDRLQNHSRLITLVKGLVGFVSPVSPSTDPVEGFSPEFQTLLRQMPLQDALKAFIAAHPDGLPYTVMKTQVHSGAPLPATPDVEKILHDNPNFFAKYPNAAPWFLPQADSVNGFDQKAYNQQLAMGLRTRKNLADWYKDYYFASAAPDYFDTEEGYKARYASAKGNPTARQALTDQWNTWKQDYYGAHPSFAETLQDPKAKLRRQDILKTMDAALNDPNAPTALHVPALRDMVDTYKGMLDRVASVKGSTNSDLNTRQALKDQFAVWAMNEAASNPGVSAFYNRVIRPDLHV